MRLSCFFLVIFIVTSLNDICAQEKRFLKDSTNKWHFRAAPYFWFLGVNGTITVPPSPSQLPEPEDNSKDIDIGFKDIKNSLKFALMLNGEYRSDKHSTWANFTSFIIRSQAITPFEYVVQGLTAQLNYFSGDIAYGYKVFKLKDMRIDATAGIKYLYVKAIIGADILDVWQPEVSFSRGYVDPAFGLRVIYTPIPRLEIDAYGDVGFSLIGWGANLTRSYQVITGANFFITPTFYLSGGYRLWNANFKDEEAIYDGKLLGGYARIGFQF